MLTVLDVPVQATTISSSRMEWLNRLEAAVAISADEELPDWPFVRSKEMHPPFDYARHGDGSSVLIDVRLGKTDEPSPCLV